MKVRLRLASNNVMWVLSLILFLAQTETNRTIPQYVIKAAEKLAPMLGELVIIMMLIALPILIFRALAGEMMKKL